MSIEINFKNLKKNISNCKKCELWKSKTNYVFGKGSINTLILFIGEAPGKNEDKFGIPFIGKAGKLLDDLLLHIDLKREDVFITNILKCRPPNNRNPSKNEIINCTEFLNHELDLIQPKIISTLGNFSSNYIFNKFKIPFDKISKIHGKIFSTKTAYGELFIIPQYHPAFAVYNPNNVKILKEDFSNIKNLIKKLK